MFTIVRLCTSLADRKHTAHNQRNPWFFFSLFSVDIVERIFNMIISDVTNTKTIFNVQQILS